MFATMAPSPDYLVPKPQSPSSSSILNNISRLSTKSARMSLRLWDWSSASAESLLTTEECSLLLEVDILDEDLLKGFPSGAPKCEEKTSPIQDDINTSLYPPSPVDEKPNRADLATELLEQFDNQCKQENIFSNWLEEKVELPMFEQLPAAAERVELPPVAPPLAYPAPQPTEELLREFETVYGAVELTHLTPPQSPPGPATQLLLSYAQQAQYPPAETWPPAQTEYDVDELVRYRAAQLTSPQTSASSSPRSSTDDEWAPTRSKPYSRNVDDRRSRKKEQNKNAATRYRQKKKAEIEVLLGEEQVLRQRHGELGDKCSDLQREIRYLKGLMRDLFKAKGLIK